MKRPKKQYNIRYKNMLSTIKNIVVNNGEKLFVNGYHFAMIKQSDEIGFQLNKMVPTLTIGMSAYELEATVVHLSEKLLHKYFHTDFDKLGPIWKKIPAKNWSKTNIFNYYNKTPFESKLSRKFQLISIPKSSKGTITNMPGFAQPVNPNVNEFPPVASKEIHKPVSSYDFIIHIPKSTMAGFAY